MDQEYNSSQNGAKNPSMLILHSQIDFKVRKIVPICILPYHQPTHLDKPIAPPLLTHI